MKPSALRPTLISLAIFALGYLLLQGALYPILRAGYDRIRVGAPGKFNRAALGELDDHLVILGSSRALVHYSPTVMGESLGADLPIANLGINAADLVEQEGLYRLLTANNRPRLIVLNLGTSELDPEVMHFHYRHLTPYFFSQPDCRRILLEENPYNLKYWLSPVSTVMADRAIAAWLGRGSSPDPDGGAALADRGWDGSYEAWLEERPNGKRYAIQPNRWAALERIAREASREGAAPMVWTIAPELAEWQSLHLNRAETLGAIARLAEANGIPLIDFADERCELCEDRAYFYNSQHLNRNGAEIFSRQAAEALAPYLAKAI